LTDPSPYKSAPGLARLRAATVYSLQGLRTAYRHESAFRQELLLTAILVPAAVVLDVTLLHKALLLGSVGVILITELLNSAVEATVDRISLDDHEYAKRAKDIGSAAVMLSLLNCAVVWALVLADAYL
jgi:diacylglycerol kinase (ATP)